MKKYIIRNSSPSIWISILLFNIFIGLSIIITISMVYSVNSFLFFVLFMIPVVTTAFILPNYFATGKIEIVLNENSIKAKFIKQPGSQKKPEVEIKLAEIIKFDFIPRRQFDKFKITDINSNSIKFFHNIANNSKDDFRQFLKEFAIMYQSNGTISKQ